MGLPPPRPRHVRQGPLQKLLLEVQHREQTRPGPCQAKIMNIKIAIVIHSHHQCLPAAPPPSSSESIASLFFFKLYSLRLTSSFSPFTTPYTCHTLPTFVMMAAEVLLPSTPMGPVVTTSIQSPLSPYLTALAYLSYLSGEPP